MQSPPTPPRSAHRQFADRLARALDYPYPAPDHDYVFARGLAQPAHKLDEVWRQGCTPILASGSNRAPEQLLRKFGASVEAPIAVERVRLRGFDVVYAAHITAYGAFPATLVEAPDAVVEVSLSWLPLQLLERMHASEGVGSIYDFVLLEHPDIERPNGERVEKAYAYVCLAGALDLGAGPMALAAIEGSGRRFPQFTQREVQGRFLEFLGSSLSVEDFVLGNIGEPEARRTALASWNKRLSLG